MKAGLFLSSASRRCNLARAHQVTNVLLKKFVVVVELVVLFSYRFDAVEDCEEGFLQSLGMPNPRWLVSYATIVQVGMHSLS